ncbi:MAG TPA: hypothetical protein VFA50_03260 [Stellaceae bacterium]|nr:hypothetical protein [Stellaceae bacterium]
MSELGAGISPRRSALRAAPSLFAPALPALFAALFFAAALPIALVKTPVMIDFFNHLGRIFVIANHDRDPLLAQYYSVVWRVIPNLAMDAVVPLLARLVGIYLAGKIFVLVSMALILTGTHALHRALWGRWSLWPLVSFLFLYNWIFLYGFINYVFGIGLALWAIAAWIGGREGSASRRGVVSLFFAAALFASHLYALGLYGLAIACYEAWRLGGNGLPRGRRAAADAAAFALPFVAVLSLMAASPTSNYALETVWSLHGKLDGLYFIVKTYWAPADLAFGAVCALIGLWALARRRLVLHPAGWTALAAFALVYLAMPTKLFGSGIADMRLPAAALFILIGMARWEMPTRRSAQWFCLAVATLALARFAMIGVYWHRYDANVAQFERSFAQITPGSRVLVAGSYDGPRSYTRETMIVHMPCLVMIERSSLESLAFTHPGKQILRVAPQFRAVSLFEGEPPPIGALLDSASAANAPASPWANWRQNFDYVYVLYSERATLGKNNGLALLFDGGPFRLYRILR